MASVSSAGEGTEFSTQVREERQVPTEANEAGASVDTNAREEREVPPEANSAGASVDANDTPRSGEEDKKAGVTPHEVLLGLLPRYRTYLIKHRFLYYAVGHDVAQSSLSGMLVTPEFNHVGIDRRVQEAAQCMHQNHVGYDLGGDQLLTLDTMTDNERKQMNFFYGGCGDCRHVYTTLYDLGRQLTEGDDRVKRGNRVHFFLNDTSPAILARCSVLLVALSDLSRFPADVIRNHGNEEVKLLLSFLHFVFISPVVPVYVYERVESIIRRLLRNPELYQGLMIGGDTWPGVRRVLQDWLMMFDGLSAEDRSREAQHLAKRYYRKQARTQERAKRQLVFSHQRKLANQVRSTGTCDPERLDTETTNKFFAMVDTTAANLSTLTTSSLLPLNVHSDIVFALVHRVVPPPRCMFRYHSSKVRQLYARLVSSQEFNVARRDISNGAAHQIARMITEDYDPMWVFQDYHPNVTAWDTILVDEDVKASRRPSKELKDYQVSKDWCALRILSKLYSTAVIEPPFTTRGTLFDLSCTLWENAAIAIGHLTTEPASSLTFELMCGDMNLEARRLAFQEERRAARGLPSRIMRAFVSNCPDYTGILFPLIDIVPRLLPSPTSFLRLNVLFKGQRWSSPENWLDVMLPVGRRDRIPDLFGVSLSAVSHLKTFLWLGRENASPPSRSVVCNALLRVLIAISFPHPEREGRRSIFPETMVAFVELMVFLLNKGVNKDWISDAINGMFLFKGAIDNPRPSPLSRDMFEKPQVSPVPFLTELRAMLGFYQPILKLNLNRLLRIEPFTAVTLRIVRIPSGLISDELEHAGMVLYSDAFSGSEVRRLALIPPEQREEVHFFSVLHWDRARNEVGFYLGETDYQKFRKRLWNILLYSSQSYKPLTAETRPVWR